MKAVLAFLTVALLQTVAFAQAQTADQLNEELKVTLLNHKQSVTIGSCRFSNHEGIVSLVTNDYAYYLVFGQNPQVIRNQQPGVVQIISQNPNQARAVVTLRASPTNAKLFNSVVYERYLWGKINDGSAADPIIRDGWVPNILFNCK
jgi:hypothetical protein